VLGVLLLTAGGWIASSGLGTGYRTGNGFLGAAVLHYVFGFGTRVLARRDARIRREEDEDFRELGLI
jgi:Na+/proline symporter